MKLSKLLERQVYKVIQGSAEIEISELVNDSRQVSQGCVFVCIRGAVVDGHKFLDEVVSKGAAAVIVETDVEAPEGVTVVRVSDTRYALALAAAAYYGYPAEELRVIGITGTKGKTTTTYMIKSILEGVGYKVGLIGTIETIIGDRVIPSKNTTPESVTIQQYFREMVDAGCDSVVMEVSSQGLMLHRTAGIPFEIGIFTNLGKDHIGPNEHKDFDDYKRCKGMLFHQCRIGIANIDDPYFEEVFKGATCSVETFGFGEKADLRATDTKLVTRPGYLGVAYHVSGFMD
ncbi:MAG: Mur ligase family protein, partial [Lachnospiraceae bacterium]